MLFMLLFKGWLEYTKTLVINVIYLFQRDLVYTDFDFNNLFQPLGQYKINTCLGDGLFYD